MVSTTTSASALTMNQPTPTFFPLHAEGSDCCRTYPRQAGAPRGVVISISRLEKNETQAGRGRARVLTPGVSAAVCAARCAAQASCRFFSISPTFRTCVLCSTCALGREGPLTKSYTSYSVVDPSLYQPLTSEPVEGVARALQGNYSLRLYGRTGAIPADLRVVWLNLLAVPTKSASVQEMIQRLGVCYFSSLPPYQPFYAPIDVGGANPMDLVWLHREPIVAAPSHSWLEVTHCPGNWSKPLTQAEYQRNCNESNRESLRRPLSRVQKAR